MSDSTRSTVRISIRSRSARTPPIAFAIRFVSFRAIALPSFHPLDTRASSTLQTIERAAGPDELGRQNREAGGNRQQAGSGQKQHRDSRREQSETRDDTGDAHRHPDEWHRTCHGFYEVFCAGRAGGDGFPSVRAKRNERIDS